MTRKKKIEWLVDSAIECNLGDSFILEHIFRWGLKGYNDFSDKELDEEILDRGFGEDEKQ